MSADTPRRNAEKRVARVTKDWPTWYRQTSARERRWRSTSYESRVIEGGVRRPEAARAFAAAIEQARWRKTFQLPGAVRRMSQVVETMQERIAQEATRRSTLRNRPCNSAAARRCVA